MSESHANDPFEKAKQLFIDGLSSYEAGRFEDAERHFVSSLALVPGRVSTLINLAATRLKLSRPQEALDVADQVLAMEPGDLDAWLHRGNALGQLGHYAQALDSYEKVLAIDPSLAQVWTHRGNILRETMCLEAAAHAFKQAIAHGGDPELNGYFLAAVDVQTIPAGAPGGYVQPLFDDYAGQYDEHMVRVLHYRAHTVLAKHLEGLVRGRFKSALDLGCGTGLCGPLVKPLAEQLTGVDLSSQMLDKARALGVYDHLVHADIVEYMRTTDRRYDLVLAADVFIYVGDLSPVFTAAQELLDTADVFCFSAELTQRDDQDFELLPSLRYAHSQRYLCALAKQHGFEIVKLLRESIREDQRQPIEGLFVYLTRR